MQENYYARAAELIAQMKDLIGKRNPIKDINLFTILGMESKEVTAHSAFLYYIFKPFEINNAIDDENLRVLYSYLRSKKTDLPENPININIYREKVFDNGRIDFLIIYDSDAIVIELKIYAEEQEDQIARYREYLRKNNYTEDNVFFLTPKKDWESKTGESIAISLPEVCDAVLYVIGKKRKNNEYNAILKQYEEIIKKIGDGYMEFSEVIKKGEDIVIIDKLYEERYQKLTSIMKNFMSKLQSELLIRIENDNDVNLSIFIPENEVKHLNVENYYVNGKSSYPAVIFNIEDNNTLLQEYVNKTKQEIDENAEFMFYAEIENYLFCGITLRKNGVDIEKLDNELSKELEEDITYFNGSYWLSWAPVLLNNNRIDFKNYNGTDGILRLLKSDEFSFDDETIKHIAEAIIVSFKKQYKGLIDRL